MYICIMYNVYTIYISANELEYFQKTFTDVIYVKME